VRKTALITGISGFVAKHCAIEFARAGYRVRGTVRDPGKIEQVRDTLSDHFDPEDLEIRVCDLLEDDGWAEAVSGCDCIIHVASPDPLAQPENEEVLVRPAVDGTLRVLHAARNNGVRKFVHTSSAFAAFYGRGREKAEYDENDWTDLDGPGVTPYAKSKTLAERAARAFVSEHPEIHYTSINPGYIFGPSLDDDLSSSIELIRLLLAGKYPGVARLCLPCVDVRDVARAHLMAAECRYPSGRRYLLVTDSPWMGDVARILRSMPDGLGRKSPSTVLPNWVVWLIGIYDRPVRSIRPELGRGIHIDGRRAEQELGFTYRSVEEAVRATAESLRSLGIIQSAVA
jgi:dihydroflavonol-4-reductase